jgi:hypothetical protein
MDLSRSDVDDHIVVLRKVMDQDPRDFLVGRVLGNVLKRPKINLKTRHKMM